MSKLRSHRGEISLIAVLMASLVAITTFYIAVSGTMSSQRSLSRVQKRALAESYAVELLEFFRSMSNDQVVSYFKVNPFNNLMPPYFWCAHINILDRTTGNIVNPDPLATLPDTTLDMGAQRANRFYRLIPVDSTTFAPDNTVCNANALLFARPATQKIEVTVGVTWLPDQNTPIGEAERIALTAILTNRL